MQCNTELAEILRFSEVDTQNAGNLVSMSNVYAADNRWADVSQKWKIIIDSNLKDKMAVDHHHMKKLFDPGGLVTFRLRWERYSKLYPDNDLVFAVDFTNEWFFAKKSYSPINWQIEMLVQFNDSKAEPPHLDWGKPLHVIILKFAFKVFDPGIRFLHLPPFQYRASTELSSFNARGE
ncbi:hypothetical protein IEQ34_003852 [Dendrobium chrysotoxum]|uniref:Uncharacterized protein n=1 Tax=Dendrobium chrysotoxum TaxID=161865 RepID=A0AAV7HEV5_DENCH|nr:hypothetical protein IEQ34_003852 [Dendrobium chrysotoxum]